MTKSILCTISEWSTISAKITQFILLILAENWLSSEIVHSYIKLSIVFDNTFRFSLIIRMPHFEAFVFKKKIAEKNFEQKKIFVFIRIRTCNPCHECQVPYPLSYPDWYIKTSKKKIKINFYAGEKQSLWFDIFYVKPQWKKWKLTYYKWIHRSGVGKLGW